LLAAVRTPLLQILQWERLVDHEDLPHTASLAKIDHVIREHIHRGRNGYGRLITIFGDEPRPIVDYKAPLCVNNAHNNFLGTLFPAVGGDTCFVRAFQLLRWSKNSGDARYEASIIDGVSGVVIVA